MAGNYKIESYHHDNQFIKRKTYSSIKFFYLLHLTKHSCQDFNKFCNKIRQENTFPSKRQTDTSTYFLYYDLVIKCLTIGSFQKNRNIILWLIKLENFENLPLACCCSQPKEIKFFRFFFLLTLLLLLHLITLIVQLIYIHATIFLAMVVSNWKPLFLWTLTAHLLKLIDYSMA